MTRPGGGQGDFGCEQSLVFHPAGGVRQPTERDVSETEMESKAAPEADATCPQADEHRRSR
jgi:hypothetical protein